MKRFAVIFSTILGASAIALGAFGAHALKKILPQEKLLSFETGIRYQMYQALALMILSLYFEYHYSLERFATVFMMSGIILFSGSIYFLSMADHWQINLRFLGPVTPIGGILMILGWVLLIWVFGRKIF